MNNISNKGFKMALPFIAGAVVGGLAIIAFNNRKSIAKSINKSLEKGKKAMKKPASSIASKITKTSATKVSRGRKKRASKTPQTAAKSE